MIDRSQDARHSVESSDALKVAALFGTRVAEPILASGHVRPHQQAGHMIASDPIHTPHTFLQAGGRPHMGSGSRDPGEARVASAGMTIEDAST